MRAPTILPALGAILGTSLSLTRAAPAQTPAEQALVNAAADTATVVHPAPPRAGSIPPSRCWVVPRAVHPGSGRRDDLGR